MQYLGGKHRLAKGICAILERHRRPGSRFVDVFCGGLSITAGMTGPRLANDGCAPLINLYRAWLDGWRPGPIDEDRYAELKERQDPDDPHTAFAGFGLSFGGKWFGGFARNSRGYDYAGAASRSIDRKLKKCSDVKFSTGDFLSVEIFDGDLVYCDPPYQGTTKYGYFDSFDYEAFKASAERWSELGADVFVSEYRAPDSWKEVGSWKRSTSQLATSEDRLFLVPGPQDTGAANADRYRTRRHA